MFNQTQYGASVASTIGRCSTTIAPTRVGCWPTFVSSSGRIIQEAGLCDYHSAGRLFTCHSSGSSGRVSLLDWTPELFNWFTCLCCFCIVWLLSMFFFPLVASYWCFVWVFFAHIVKSTATYWDIIKLFPQRIGQSMFCFLLQYLLKVSIAELWTLYYAWVFENIIAISKKLPRLILICI